MFKKLRKTAGALQLQAASDPTRYNAMEVAQAMCDDIVEQLRECAHKHYDFFDIPSFCIVMLLASDPLIKGLMRRKFYAWGFLPQPRPQQSVFLFTKATSKKEDTLIRLWTLPDAMKMATISETMIAPKNSRDVKYWCDLFYEGVDLKDPSVFWNGIRKQHKIEMLAEAEYLDRKGRKVTHSLSDEVCPLGTDSFDFFKGMPKQIIHAE